MGRLYWFKHGVESVFDPHRLLLPGAGERADAGDLAVVSGFVAAGGALRGDAEQVGCSVVWGASNNQRMTWWRDDARATLGWAPQDSADPFAGQLAGKVSGDPVEERYMGGGFCAIGYSAVRAGAGSDCSIEDEVDA